MKNAGMAHMGVGRAAGKGKAEEAAKMAISSPLLETSIEGAKGVLINVTGSMDIGLEEVEQVVNNSNYPLFRKSGDTGACKVAYGAGVMCPVCMPQGALQKPDDKT